MVRTVLLACELNIARLRYIYGLILAALLVAGALLWWLLFSSPAGFPVGTMIDVPEGASVTKVATLFESEHVISCPLMFRVLFRLMPHVHGAQSGRYLFARPAGTFQVAWNVAHGITGVAQVRITIPEGTAVAQMATILASALPAFDTQTFLAEAKPLEGYLFPDTYYVMANATPEQVIARMEANFAVHRERFTDLIAKSGHTEKEIVVMASLLEGEGKTLEDKRLIAGILWKRIALHMPLQVDAPFAYLHEVTGYTPTATDLESASPYNTYRHKGLPPGPINNPGDEALEAALTPTQSPYLYYLTGTDGMMHYAKTFAEHIENQKKYLK